MEYDYRNHPPPSHGHRPAGPGASSLYPRVGPAGLLPPMVGRNPYQTSGPPPSSSSTLGIRVAIKPEYCITPPTAPNQLRNNTLQPTTIHSTADREFQNSVRETPPLAPQMGEIPRSSFQFDFEFEKKILEEAEKESQNWTRIAAEDQPPRIEASNSSVGPNDALIGKYVSSGLSYEAVSLAVANYGDNPSKVQEFAKGFNILREMGFRSNNVAEALALFDNDTDKALAHLISP